MASGSATCVCSLCSFSSPTRSLWLSHLRSVHGEDDHFFVTCDINQCGASYSKCASLVSHIYRQHREIISSGRKPNRGSRQTDDFEDYGYSDGQDVSINEDNGECSRRTDLQHAIDQILQTDGIEQQKKGALYTLSLKVICGLSESAVNYVINENQKVFDHTIGRAKAGVHECVSRASVSLDESLVEDINQFFSRVKDPFEGLHSTFLQESFYRQHFRCLVCDCEFVAGWIGE